MKHVEIAFTVSGNASDLTGMEFIDRPVVDHHQFTTKRFFVVQIHVFVAHYISIFLGKDFPPVLREIFWFMEISGVARMQVLRTLLT